jgi:DNA invertase Pin-like site-specific DNA recombinase
MLAVLIQSAGTFMEHNMKIGYCRVSTSDQKLDMQVDALEAFGCRKIFTETTSGASKERPKLSEALSYARAGDELVVWSMTRLGRSLSQLVKTVEDLDARSIGFHSLKEKIDTTTPSGRLIFHVFASLAEFERETLRERTVEGLQAARRRGRIGGRPKALSDSDLKAAKAMLRDKTISVSEVAEKLSVSRSTLYRYMVGGRDTGVQPIETGQAALRSS